MLVGLNWDTRGQAATSESSGSSWLELIGISFVDSWIKEACGNARELEKMDGMFERFDKDEEVFNLDEWICGGDDDDDDSSFDDNDDDDDDDDDNDNDDDDEDEDETSEGEDSIRNIGMGGIFWETAAHRSDLACSEYVATWSRNRWEVSW